MPNAKVLSNFLTMPMGIVNFNLTCQFSGFLEHSMKIAKGFDTTLNIFKERFKHIRFENNYSWKLNSILDVESTDVDNLLWQKIF